MCDFCGCPEREPFASLTQLHEILLLLAEAFAKDGDARDLEILRDLWPDHRASEQVVGDLATLAGFDAEWRSLEGDATRIDAVLADETPDGAALLRALQDHAGDHEYDLFPHIMFALEPEEIDGSLARLPAAARR